MKTGIEIALELLRLYANGTSGEEAVTAMRQRFPDVTLAELERGSLIAFDQVDMWKENEEERRRDAAKAFDLMVSGAPETEIAAAFQQLKITPDNVIPQRPRRDAS
jgi:hypothetical protein